MATLQNVINPPAVTRARVRTVAILESSAKMGGIQHTTLALATRLDRSVWNPVLICPEDGELTSACRDAGIQVVTLPVLPMCSTSVWISNATKLPNPAAWVWNAATILASSRRIAKSLTALSPDLVITKGLLCHFYGGLAARSAGVPCLWYVQDFVSERFGGIYRSAFGAMARRVPTGIAAIGPQIVRQLPEDLRGRARVVYNAIDPAKYREGNGQRVRCELGIPPDVFVIGNAARLTPWKGQHHLIEAFSQISALDPDARLVLAGGSLFGDSDYEGRLRRMIVDRNLESRVIFAGHRSDMNDVFAMMDVFAYASVEKDICPLSLLEAMSAGLPVAAFDIEGVREAIADDVDGLLVPNGDAGAMAHALVELMRDNRLRRSLGESARARIARQFSLDQHVIHMEEAMQAQLSAKP